MRRFNLCWTGVPEREAGESRERILKVTAGKFPEMPNNTYLHIQQD